MTRRPACRLTAKLTIAVCAAVTLAGVFGSATATAHTLEMIDALDNVNAYAQRVVNDPRVPYIAKQVTCKRLFPHQIRCWAKYDTPGTEPTTRFACIERIIVYYKSHSIGTQFEVKGGYKQHETNPCGLIRLSGPNP